MPDMQVSGYEGFLTLKGLNSAARWEVICDGCAGLRTAIGGAALTSASRMAGGGSERGKRADRSQGKSITESSMGKVRDRGRSG